LGLILDTSVLVSAERKRHSVADILEQILISGNADFGVSAVIVSELAHALGRAKLAEHHFRHRAFLNDVKAAIAVYPVTIEIAERAGEIGGQMAAQGLHIPYEDLLIGVTALHLGYEVLTTNERHFAMIPGLVVKKP
jgi:predicted nucleic acid-binding protein